MIAVSAGPILGSILCELPGCLDAIGVNAAGFNVRRAAFARRGASAGAGLGLLSRGCQAGLWQAPRGLLQQGQLKQPSAEEATSPASRAGAGRPRGKGRRAGRLALTAGRQLAQAAGREGRVPLSGSWPHLSPHSGNRPTELCLALLIRARPPHAVIPNGVVD